MKEREESEKRREVGWEEERGREGRKKERKGFGLHLWGIPLKNIFMALY